MCTVTYIPKGKDKFIFTTNRDEAPKRSAMVMANIELPSGKKVTFPQDAKAQGTWIAISDQNQLACILNGAFEKHKHEPPYRLSRGIMALDFFKFKNAETFFQEYNFEGIEPFTFVIYDNGNLWELRWDEQETHVLALVTDEKHLWASCTLYDQEWQGKRRTWFADWLSTHPTIIQEDIIDFHKNGGEGHPIFDLVMNYKDIVRTTSITSVNKLAKEANLKYEGIPDGKILLGQLKF